MQQIMIIEDDSSIRDELVLLLKNEGYKPWAVSDFTDSVKLAAKIRPNLILLDINLPGQDGYSLCVSLRKVVDAPIIFVTSRDSSLDEIRALSLGGDDYITKPYNIPVLLARIKAALRRNGQNSDPEVLETDGISLNLAKGTLYNEKGTVLLTRNELQIMACLISRPGEIVTRTELIETLWEHQIYIDDNTLSVNMTRLRNKLDDLGLRELIQTRRGMGYQI